MKTCLDQLFLIKKLYYFVLKMTFAPPHGILVGVIDELSWPTSPLIHLPSYLFILPLPIPVYIHSPSIPSFYPPKHHPIRYVSTRGDHIW